MTIAMFVLGAGAAKGLASRLQNRFHAETGAELKGTFSAVGAIESAFRSGDPCDVLILTAQQIQALTDAGDVFGDTATAIGAVATSLAVPTRQPVPSIGTAEALKAALIASNSLYVPDMKASTAGRHVLATLRALGIEADMRDRIREYKNGETAMHALATEAQSGAIGCTQITEIMNTPGLTSAGPLPSPYALETVYSAAVSKKASQPVLARQFVTLLTGEKSTSERLACGFSVPRT